MILALFIANTLLGNIPESVGLLLFGVSLVAITVGLRWFLDMDEKKNGAERKF
jgi:heme/copper-type cytochrome/quinol oxidase subunit 4